eukprot:1798253-Pleurochrysis_carterae.AAC.1
MQGPDGCAAGVALTDAEHASCGDGANHSLFSLRRRRCKVQDPCSPRLLRGKLTLAAASGGLGWRQQRGEHCARGDDAAQGARLVDAHELWSTGVGEWRVGALASGRVGALANERVGEWVNGCVGEWVGVEVIQWVSG